MMKTHIALIALLLSVSLLLQSCGIIVLNTSDEEDTAPAEDSTAADTAAPDTDASGHSVSYVHADRTEEYQAYADAYLNRIADSGFSFEGEVFFISTPLTEVILPADTENTYSSAVYKRNQAVENMLNIRIASSAVDEAAYFDLLNTSILADEYFSDLLMIPEYQIGTFAAGDALMNLRSAPMLDLEQPYFHADSVEAATGGSKIFAVAGEASMREDTLSAVFFNRDLFEANSIAVPYDLVYEGKWTWDAFFTSCAQVNGINQNSAQGTGTISSYAIQYAADLLPAMVHASGGAKMVRSEVDSSPVISIVDDGVLDVISSLYSDANKHKDINSGVSHFYNGQSLYLIDRLYLMSWMPDSTQNWGILPIPKLTEWQSEHITLADPGALFFAMQKNIVDSQKSAVILSALNAASYGVLREAYVHYAMNQLLRDNDSANMLAIISASCTYDFALAFEGTTSSLSEATTAGLRALADGLSAKSLLNRAAAANKRLSVRFPASAS